MQRIVVDVQTGQQSVVDLTQAEIDQIISNQPAPVIPSVVSMRQARLALLQSGLLSTVDAAIAAGSEADKITWEYATEVNRNDLLVTNLSTVLGLTSKQLDDLFTLAASL